MVATERRHAVRVEGIPVWVGALRLLGEGDWSLAQENGTTTARADLNRMAAASIMERLRKVGLDGHAIRVAVEPPLSRGVVRDAKLVEARRRRERTPGFLRSGTRVDDEGRFSLTPEQLAINLARRAPGKSVVDACCGAGGNAIAFAVAGLDVTAIEIDTGRLELARHNARIYGVDRKIRFLQGDARILLADLRADLLFIDPPWGETYDRERTTADDYPLLGEIFSRAASDRFAHVWAKLPPSFDTKTLADSKPEAIFGAAPGDRDRIKMVLVVLR